MYMVHLQITLQVMKRGAIYNKATITAITDSVFTGNSALVAGGAIANIGDTCN